MNTEKNMKEPGRDARDNRMGATLRLSVLRLLVSLRDFFRSTMNLTDDLDREGTVETIKNDMVFRGHIVWILICSIFIASIGLNINSTAIVIGAMLISPLMGPILGIGLSVGTNDWDMLQRALKHFGVMVAVALVTSTIYFMITPLHEAQPEMLARTKPTLLDALIGIFGGLAGIIGVSRRNRGNVVPGVAIATALMPPLCTAGYGLANGEWYIFLGAFYLFTLNSIFIAAATLVIVRYLRFPLMSFVDSRTEKRAKRYMIAFVFVVLLPSGWIFFGLIEETIFQGRAERFISQNFAMEGTEVISKKILYSDTVSRIDVFIMGEPITEQMQAQLRHTMVKEGLENTVLGIHQPKDISSEIAGKLSQNVRVGLLEDMYKKNEHIIASKDSIIQYLEHDIANRSKKRIPIDGITKEVRILHPHIQRLSFAQTIEIHDGRPDTLPTFLVRWDGKTGSRTKSGEKKVLSAWLTQRLNMDTLQIIEF